MQKGFVCIHSADQAWDAQNVPIYAKILDSDSRSCIFLLAPAGRDSPDILRPSWRRWSLTEPITFCQMVVSVSKTWRAPKTFMFVDLLLILVSWAERVEIHRKTTTFETLKQSGCQTSTVTRSCRCCNLPWMVYCMYIAYPPRKKPNAICGSSFLGSLVSWLRWICGNSAKWNHEESSWMHHGHLTSSLSWQFGKQQTITGMFKDDWRISSCFVIARLAEACYWTDIALMYLMSLVSWPCTVCKLHSLQQSNQQK